MMEDSSSNDHKTALNADGGVWRAELTPELRLRVVNHIRMKLKDNVASDRPEVLNRIAHIAKQFEEKVFQEAETKQQYLTKISRKVEYYLANPPAFSTPASNTGLEPMRDASSKQNYDVGHGSDFVSGYSHNFVAQKIQSKNPLNSHNSQFSEQVFNPLHQGQDLQNQFLKRNVQNTNICSSLHQPITYSNNQHLSQFRSTSTSQSSQPLYSQQSRIPTSESFHQPALQHPSNSAVLRQRLQQQQQQQPQSTFQQSNASRLPQHQQNMVGQRSSALNLGLHQQSNIILQPAAVSTPGQNIQTTMQPVQLHNIVGSQKQNVLSMEGLQQRLRAAAAANQYQNISDQQKLFQSQRSLGVLSSASESKAPIELGKVVNWHDQAYQKLQRIKQQCGSHLDHIQIKFKSFSDKAAKPEQVEYWKKNLIIIERLKNFLYQSRIQFEHCTKDKLDYFEQYIVKYMSTFQRKNIVSAQQQTQPSQPPGGQSQMSQFQQNRNMKIQSHATSLALTSRVDGLSSVSSPQTAASHAQPNPFSSLQWSSGMRLQQRNPPSTFQHSSSQNHYVEQQHLSSRSADVRTLGSAANGRNMLPQNLKDHMQSQIVQRGQQNMLLQNVQPGVTSGFVSPQNLLPTSSQLHATTQMSQRSSPRIDQRALLSTSSKSATPSQPTKSPIIAVSSSTPPTPSLLPTEPDARNSNVSRILVSEKRTELKKHVDTEIQNNHFPSTGECKIINSPMPTNRTVGSKQSSVRREPIEWLLKAVQSLSPEALSACVHEIGTVIDTADKISENFSDSPSSLAVGEDLAFKTRCHIQARNSNLKESMCESKIKDQIGTVVSEALHSLVGPRDSIERSEYPLSDSGSTASSRFKRRRIQPDNELLVEIRHINQQLVETEVTLNSTEGEASQGTLVRCSYTAVAVSENLRPYASFPVLDLRLLVPLTYPNSSPIILDSLSGGLSGENNKLEDILEKTKLKFTATVRSLSEPISLEEMVKTWDRCARGVVIEYAQLLGGECFSCRYGKWESCATA